jgi:hypothetical protein
MSLLRRSKSGVGRRWRDELAATEGKQGPQGLKPGIPETSECRTSRQEPGQAPVRPTKHSELPRARSRSLERVGTGSAPTPQGGRQPGRDHCSLDSFSPVRVSNVLKYRLGLKSKNAGVAGTAITEPC